MKISQKNESIPAEMVCLEHEWFFKYLRISPSYQLAHAIHLGEKKKISARDIPQFSEVMSTYKLFGDVFNTNFPAWWETKAHLLFKKQMQVNIFVRLDLTKSRSQTLVEVKKLIDAEYAARSSANNSIALQNNKIRVKTLEGRFHYVVEKANNSIVDAPKVPGWRLLDFSENLNTKHSIRHRTQRKLSNAYERGYLTMLSSRYLQEALALAENAARGKFPSLEKSGSPLKFDFEKIDKYEGYGAYPNPAPYSREQYLNSPTLKQLKLLAKEASNKAEMKRAKNKEIKKALANSYVPVLKKLQKQ